MSAEVERLGAELDRLDAEIADAEASLVGALLHRWPVLDDPWHPRFAEALAGSETPSRRSSPSRGTKRAAPRCSRSASASRPSTIGCSSRARRSSGSRAPWRRWTSRRGCGPRAARVAPLPGAPRLRARRALIALRGRRPRRFPAR
ncbi:MAG: hypothetical protein M5U28_20750 [Sandaracinaceae bacterium]|nr:hypothetical protein [Sandaracinaceae bacterium]